MRRWREARFWSIVVLILAVLAAGFAAAVQTGTSAHAKNVGVPDPNLNAPVGAEWPSNGGNLTNQRYSTLSQITTANVKNLKAAWVVHLHSGLGMKYSLEGTPIVQGDVMYVSTGADDVLALNARTGATIWEYHAYLSPKISTVCCGWDNHGVAVGGGRVYVAQLGGSIVALSQSTGRVLWHNHLVNWQNGYTFTLAPLYYNGVLYIGPAGAEFGTRGRIYALDANTGRMLWRFWTIPGPGQPGHNTWPAHTQAYIHGGASLWNTPALDPNLGLLYFSTGNAGPDLDGSPRRGKNLYSASILALHLNGTLAWYFQEVHHDIWDFDAPSPVVLFDVMLHGQLRHAVAEVGKTGWAYILDRTNGKPLIGINERRVPQSALEKTAPTQPYPVGQAVIPQCAPQVLHFPRSACIFTPPGKLDTVFAPAFEGGVVQSPISFSPQTNYLYVGANVWPFDFVVKPQPWKKGQFYVGYGTSTTLLGAHRSGTLSAVDVRTNRLAWHLKTTYPLGEGSGMMATAGGLVFNGQPDGNLVAYNGRTGRELWHWQTGAGADAPPISYAVNGVQYMAIEAGGNSLIGSKNGDALWAFSLRGSASRRTIPQAATPKPPYTVVTINGPIVHTNRVAMIDFGFTAKGNPKYKNEIHVTSSRNTVPVGTTVTWVNTGTQPHTATSTGFWDTGIVMPGHSASVVMKKVGTFNYYCTPHPWMLGQVIVTAK